MRIAAGVVLGLLLPSIIACGSVSGGLFRQYEYDEEMFLSLDGAATIYVNSSIPALNALRGTSFDARPSARIDRDLIRRYYTSPGVRVTRVTESRRRGRRFVHLRLDVDDVRQLGETMAFAWSSYRLRHDGGLVVYVQNVGPAAEGAAAAAADQAGWTANELVAFRIHIPSVIEYHNAGADNLRRGNIVVWEQPLAERLKGTPLELEARMQPQSILYRTLGLFAAMFAAVAATFALVIWRVVSRGKRHRTA